MKRKAKIDLTLEAILSAITAGATSLTAVSKAMGLSKGAVSGSTAKAIRKLMPDVDKLLAANKAPKGIEESGKAKVGKVAKLIANAPIKGSTSAKVRPAGTKGSKYAHDPRNPFKRQGSSYSVCFDILASYPKGLNREELIRLLAAETKKDLKRASFDCQVLLSAKENDNEKGLSNNDSPRHRSCRAGFWVKRTNGHVQLMVD